MPASRIKLLLDENVRRELYDFLKTQSVDVRLSPKGLKNGEIANFALKESRILITNDKDFTVFPARKIPGVIWLKIPQEENPEGLIQAFSRFLNSTPVDLISKLTIISPSHFEFSNL